jgi:transposase-like protein
MDEESKTADGRRRWRHWTEEQARVALDELAQSGLSVAKFAQTKGVSTQRIAYWKKRLAESAPMSFVAVPSATPSRAQAPTSPGIEVVMWDGAIVRVREDIDVEHLARIVEAVARRSRGC